MPFQTRTRRAPSASVGIGFLIAGLFVAIEGPAAGSQFALRGRPIAPQCLEPFFRGGAERPPRVTVIDLDSCAAMATAGPAWEDGRDGRRSFRRTLDGHAAGFFGYRFRGRTTDGVEVLEAWGNDGGSGTYTEIFLVRLQDSRLSLVHSISGGDRCIAGIADSAVHGRDVTVDFRLGAADLVGLASALAHTRVGETPELDLGSGPPNDCEGAARFRYAPATSDTRQLVGIDYRPTDRIVRGASAEARCLREAFGARGRFLGRRALRRAAESFEDCLAEGDTN